MSISFSCTGCGRTLKVADELAGRKAKCPQCQTVLYIPEGPAVAMTPAPTPARRHAMPIPPPQEEYDDRGDEPVRAPRRRTQPKKSGMGVLLAVGAVVLVLLLAAAGFTAWWFWGGGPSGAAALAEAQDLPFMPDGVQMVGQVQVNQGLNSDAFKQLLTTFGDPKTDARKQIEDGFKQSSGLDLNNIDRLYFGTAKVDTSFGGKTPAFVVIMHFKNSMKVDELKSAMKKSSSGSSTTFSDTKVGKYTMTELKTVPASPNPMAFTMPDDKRVVLAAPDVLKAVLTRDKKPDINPTLQKAIEKTDWSATAAFAANVKDGFVIPSQQAQATGLPLDKVDGLSVTIKVATDVDVNVTAMCKDNTAASDLSGGINTLIKAGTNQPNMASMPPEVKDLMNITAKADGSNVTIAKTIKVAPLLALAKKSGGGMPFPFNPFGGGGPVQPPPRNFPPPPGQPNFPPKGN